MHWIWKNLIICSSLGIGVFAFLFYSETGQAPFVMENLSAMLIAVLLLNMGGAILHQFSTYISKRVNWRDNINVRFLSEILVGQIIFSILAAAFLYFYLIPYASQEVDLSFQELYGNGIIKYFIISTVLIVVYTIINFTVFSFKQYAVGQLQSLEMERDQLHLQLQALKSQLSPHFLFNALNTISALIYKSSSITEDYIRKLAKTYAYILTTQNRQLVFLKEELEMTEAYFYMQETKYEDCISLSVQIAPELMQSLIPPLSLQILVENALKHNQICDKTRLAIEIYHDENENLVVKNNVIKKPVLLKIGNDLYEKPRSTDSHKIGLNNIKQRYRYYSGKDISISHQDYFIVSLPKITTAYEA